MVREAVEALSRIGFTLRRPINGTDLAVDPDTAREQPEWYVLQALDDDGRPFLHRVFRYDAECITDDESYPRLIKELAAATQQAHLLGDVTSQLDFEAGTGWVSYEFEGRTERVEVEVDGDWADGAEVDGLFNALGVPDCWEVYLASGQGGTYYWVPDDGLETFKSFVPDEELPNLNL
ncbi:hypothetical protein ACQBAR_10140 [Propionibacteriaceae bacterium Y1685]|uniref:hypothetical protein n=1 Tax=Microlunatus sp. Y1700 TaxID=3418487 RepID=UPI003D5019A0